LITGHGCVDSPPMTTATSSTSSNPSMAPERSLNQRMDALARANEIRVKRAELKRDLKAGRHSIHTLLLDPPEYVETAKVFDMLLAVPKYGRVKVNKILAHCRIAPSKTIGGLSERQRSELVSLLHR
jgi:S13-like H2TH domain